MKTQTSAANLLKSLSTPNLALRSRQSTQAQSPEELKEKWFEYIDKQNIKAAKRLLRAYPDLANAQDEYGLSALHKTVISKNILPFYFFCFQKMSRSILPQMKKAIQHFI